MIIENEEISKKLCEVLTFGGDAKKGLFGRIYGLTVFEFYIRSEQLDAKFKKIMFLFVVLTNDTDYLSCNIGVSNLGLNFLRQRQLGNKVDVIEEHAAPWLLVRS